MTTSRPSRSRTTSAPSAPSAEPASFAQAYAQLREGVDTLRQSNIADIDQLLPLVERTTEAYRQCKARLDAVDLLIKGALGGENSGS